MSALHWETVKGKGQGERPPNVQVSHLLTYWNSSQTEQTIKHRHECAHETQ